MFSEASGGLKVEKVMPGLPHRHVGLVTAIWMQASRSTARRSKQTTNERSKPRPVLDSPRMTHYRRTIA